MFSTAEYQTRFKKLQQSVKEEKLKAFIVSSEENIYYLTGVSYRPLERPFFIVVRPDDDPVLVVPLMEEEHLKEAPNVTEIHAYREYPAPVGKGWADILKSVLGKRKITVGVEPGLALEIAGELTGYNLKALPLLENIRMVKSETEVDKIRTTAQYCDAGMDLMLKAAYYGISELEIFSQSRSVLLNVMKETDFEPVTTDLLTMSWVAPMSAQPHSVPSVDDRLKGGPHIAMSFMRVNGYAAECERTWFLSDPKSEEEKAFKAMMKARERALSFIAPGISCNEIDKEVNGFIEGMGYGENLLHRTGHGFGLSNHEGPWVAEGSSHVLEKNMLISIEPGIYIPGTGGFRHSDTVLVTESGSEVLTAYPVDIESLRIRGYRAANRLKGKIIRKVAGINRPS